jgi:hypothetical protein
VQDVGFPGTFITHYSRNISNFDKVSFLDIVKDDMQSYYNFIKGIEAEG